MIVDTEKLMAPTYLEDHHDRHYKVGYASNDSSLKSGDIVTVSFCRCCNNRVFLRNKDLSIHAIKDANQQYVLVLELGENYVQPNNEPPTIH